MRFRLASFAVDRDQEVIKSLPPFSALALNTRTQTCLSCTEDAPYSNSLLLRLEHASGIIASDNNTEYKCQDTLDQPTKQKQ